MESFIAEACNFLVTLSNIFGLYPITRAIASNDNISLLVSVLATIGSILQHLSDTKHGQNGLLLVKYSKQLLILDRITAVTSAMYILYCIYRNPSILYKNHCKLCYIIPFGLVLNFISESPICEAFVIRHLHSHKLFFIITHSLWHYFAFNIMGNVIKYKSR